MAQFSVNMPAGGAALLANNGNTPPESCWRGKADRYPELMLTLSSRAFGKSKGDALTSWVRCVLDGIGLLVAERATTRLGKSNRRSASDSVTG